MNRCWVCGCRIMDDEDTCQSFRCMEVAADDGEPDEDGTVVLREPAE